MSGEFFAEFSMSELTGNNSTDHRFPYSMDQSTSSHAQDSAMGARNLSMYPNPENGFLGPTRQGVSYQHSAQNPNILAHIGSASRERLIASENKAFFQLLVENIRLQAELDSRNEMLAHFKEKDRHSAPPQNREVPSPPSVTTDISIASSKPSLKVPPSPAPLSEHDYEEAAFWDQEDWKKFCDKERASGRTPKRVAFVTDVEGNRVSPARITQMTTEAYLLWTSLYGAREDPASWKKKSKFASDYFSNSMRGKFIEFRLCEGDWKVESFAINKFPDWNRYSRESGNLTRTMPSINFGSGTGKRKGDSADTKSRPPKKIKREIPDVSVNVIDLDSDGDVICSSSSVSGSSMSVESAPIAGKTASEPPRSTSTDLTLSDAASTSKSRAVSPALNSLAGTPPPEVSHSENPPLTIAEPRVVAEGEADENAQAIVNPVPRRRRGRTANPLSGMVIPKPAAELLTPVVAQETVPPAPVPMSDPKSPAPGKITSKKGSKLMEPNKTVSARNLFAIDYLKTHQVTAADFKIVYDALDEETKKKYEALSREKKKKTT